MDWKYRFLSFVAAFLLFSCAQVGPINGGAKDEYAPGVVEMDPPNASTRFTSKEITIEFDEYFKLNSPQDNIIVLPADLKVEATVSKRKLKLTFQNEPSPNTTYQISLNNLVKDISEGNDSLIQYVFSTGESLDSLVYSGSVADAYSAQAMNQVLVGLYHDEDSIESKKPLYFTKTDAAGKFSLNYLKAGKYRVYAFDDENKTLTYQKSEKAAFRTDLLNLTESLTDSIPLQLFPGKKPSKISTKQLHAPRMVRLKAGFPLYADSIFYQGMAIAPLFFHAYTQDSATILLSEYPADEVQLIVKHDGLSDTLQLRKSLGKTYFYAPEIVPANKDLSSSKALTLRFADIIKEIDTTLISATTKDSIKQSIRYNVAQNQLHLTFADTLEKDIQLVLRKNALKFEDGSGSDSLNFSLQIKPERSFGSLLLKTISLPENSLVEVYKEKKLVRLCPLQQLKKENRLAWLEPGEYRFRIVVDANQNGKWDGGDVLLRRQSEKVLQFPETIKIRANWEAEIEFELEP